MWSVDYVQVPKDDRVSISLSIGNGAEVEKEEEKFKEEKLEDKDRKSRVHEQLVKQMSISAEFEPTNTGMF